MVKEVNMFCYNLIFDNKTQQIITNDRKQHQMN